MRTDLLYDRLHAECRTLNQLNEVHITLANRMTPLAAVEVAEHIRTRYGPDAAVASGEDPADLEESAVLWASTLLRAHALAGGGAPASFSRTWIRGGATMYRRSSAPARSLLVCLTGNARRMMMPAPTFLQFLGGYDVDVLKLEALDERGYIVGVPGHTGDFPSTVRWIETIHARSGSERLLCMGTSLGALPAIALGLRLPSERILAGGAVEFGAAEFVPDAGFTSMEDLLAALAAERSDVPALSLAYGDLVPRDVETARRIKESIECREVLAVEGATHNCLYPLVERGTFADLLERSLFPDE